MIDAGYVDDFALLPNSPDLAESKLYRPDICHENIYL